MANFLLFAPILAADTCNTGNLDTVDDQLHASMGPVYPDGYVGTLDITASNQFLTQDMKF